MYKQTSGMHTVQQWLTGYDKHPYAWGALIAIHGVEEISFRLRSKVANYAVYSAVLLTASIMLLLTPSSKILEDGSIIYRYIYLYSTVGSIGCHMFSILAGMVFTNALNEAARDSDVIRMFAEGKGYLATLKSEQAFQFGLLFGLISLCAGIASIYHWIDAIVCFFLLAGSIAFIYIPMRDALFDSSSLMSYWRFGKGTTDESRKDPYDLSIPMENVLKKAFLSEKLYEQLDKAHLDHTIPTAVASLSTGDLESGMGGVSGKMDENEAQIDDIIDATEDDEEDMLGNM